MKRARRLALFFILIFSIPAASWSQELKPIWKYKTWAPFFAGWSEAGTPVIDDDRVYVCMGYGWWDHKVAVIALEKTTGKEIWKKEIEYACRGLREAGGRIIADVKYHTVDRERLKLGPGKGTVWHEQRIVLNKEDGGLSAGADLEPLEDKPDRFDCSYKSEPVDSGHKPRLICSSVGTKETVFEDSDVSSVSFTMVGDVLYYWPGGGSNVTYAVDLNAGARQPLPFPLASSILAHYKDQWLFSAVAHDVAVVDLKSRKIIKRLRTQGWVKGVTSDGRLLFIADDSGTLSAFELDAVP